MKKISALPNSNADGVGGFDYGSVKDASAPGLYDGTPFRADWQNDIQAFFQRMLTEAAIVPNGSSDTPATSQLYDALIGSFPVLSSGSTSAGFSVVSGVSSVSDGNITWSRVGNTVSFSGTALVQNSTTTPIIAITPPVASNFSNNCDLNNNGIVLFDGQCTGVMTTNTGSGIVFGNGTSEKINVYAEGLSVGLRTWFFSGTYIVK